MTSTLTTAVYSIPPHPGALSITGDPLADIGLAIGVGLLVLWLVLVVRERDAEAGTDRWLSLVGGVVLGIVSIGIMVVDSLATAIAEVPGFIAAGFAGVIGYLGIEDVIGISGSDLLAVVLLAIIVAIAIRSGQGGE